MIRFLALTVPLLLISAPAFAQEAHTDPAAAKAVPVAATETPKKICKSFGVTGRRIAKRVCYTAAQWDELARVRSEAADKLITDVSRAAAQSNLSSNGDGALNTNRLFGFADPVSPQ